jgi:hypothetical protein
MDRLLRMILNLLLLRGLRRMARRLRGSRRASRPGEAETAQRLRDTARLARRLRR